MSAAEAFAGVGHNQPPEPTPFEQHTDTVDTLYMEGENWLDGTPIANQAQADEVTRLRDMAKKAGKAADEQRAAEKRPHDDAGKAVQAQWKPLLERVAKVEKAATGLLTGWLVAEDARKRREAEEVARLARKADERARAEHAAAARSGNLSALEAAEDSVSEAAMLAREARSADKAKATAKVDGMTRAVGLTTVCDVTIAGEEGSPERLKAEQELARYFWQTQRTRVVDCYLTLAREAVRGGGRSIPGCTVTSRQVAR